MVTVEAAVPLREEVPQPACMHGCWPPVILYGILIVIILINLRLVYIFAFMRKDTHSVRGS